MMLSPPIAQLLELLRLPGVSTQERAIAAYVQEALAKLEIDPHDIRLDRAFEQSEYGGDCGNLIVRLPARGGHAGAARLFLCHMDTVPLCRGCGPRFVPGGEGMPDRIVNDNTASALGGDCRAGVAILLHLARLLSEAQRRPPIWLVFTVQEELGLIGARGLELTSLQPEPPVMGFNFDGTNVAHIVRGVIGNTRFFIDIHGKAAHAGLNPQDGVSAAAVQAVALAELVREGWHARINKPHGAGCANIGVINGGEMTNTVMSELAVRGEARSHDAAFRREILGRFRDAFQRAAAATRNAAGEAATISWKLGPSYESFHLADDHPVVSLASQALRELGVEPVLEINDGGMDNNWLNAKGLPSVALGVGQRQIHTVNEWIHAGDFLTACQLGERLALAE